MTPLVVIARGRVLLCCVRDAGTLALAARADHAYDQQVAIKLVRREAHAEATVRSFTPDYASPDVDLIALDDALTALAEIDARAAQIVELRFFSGLTIEEKAEVLAVSPGTIKRDWTTARAWLYRELSGASG